MFARGANVLIVDDDPGVLSLTTLAMKSFKVDGVPLKIRTAGSRAEAEGLLLTTYAARRGFNGLSVAFVDLEMESAQAGLEVCRYIREDVADNETQIYIRAEGRGAAPEREIFDRYDINGYYTKAEVGDDRLYSMTKTGVRRYRTLARHRVFMGLLEVLIVAGSKPAMAEALERAILSLAADGAGRDSDLTDPRASFVLDGEVVAKHPALSEGEVLQRWHALRPLRGTALGRHGDRYATDDRYFLLQVAAGPERAECGYLCPLTGESPDSFARQFYAYSRCIAALWKQAR